MRPFFVDNPILLSSIAMKAWCKVCSKLLISPSGMTSVPRLRMEWLIISLNASSCP